MGTLENYFPFVHTFATNHDDVVGTLYGLNVPDLIANFPTMPPILIFSVGQELLNLPASVSNFLFGTDISPPLVHEH